MVLIKQSNPIVNIGSESGRRMAIIVGSFLSAFILLSEKFGKFGLATNKTFMGPVTWGVLIAIFFIWVGLLNESRRR